jgi:hypothetical protein
VLKKRLVCASVEVLSAGPDIIGRDPEYRFERHRPANDCYRHRRPFRTVPVIDSLWPGGHTSLADIASSANVCGAPLAASHFLPFQCEITGLNSLATHTSDDDNADTSTADMNLIRVPGSGRSTMPILTTAQ